MHKCIQHPHFAQGRNGSTWDMQYARRRAMSCSYLSHQRSKPPVWTAGCGRSAAAVGAKQPLIPPDLQQHAACWPTCPRLARGRQRGSVLAHSASSTRISLRYSPLINIDHLMTAEGMHGAAAVTLATHGLLRPLATFYSCQRTFSVSYPKPTGYLPDQSHSAASCCSASVQCGWKTAAAS